MKKLVVLLLLALTILTGCNASNDSEKDTITMVWYPNESGADLEESRNHLAKLISEATGKIVEHELTTDYAIAIESIANGKADLAFMGAQGYVEAKNKNENLRPLTVPSGSDGTLDSAVYYSWLAVNKGDEPNYASADGFSIDNIKGKRFSFVSNSSTSGFKVPSSSIINHFSDDNLTEESLSEGGEGNFFSEVLFGGSHQGSAINLLTGRADVAAFCDTCVFNYVELAEGEENKPGSTYKVRDDAAEPFQDQDGKEFVIISSTPVLNAPFVANLDTLSEEDFTKIRDMMTSDEVAKDPLVFVPEDAETKGLFTQDGDRRFLEVEDAWFNPIRELSK